MSDRIIKIVNKWSSGNNIVKKAQINVTLMLELIEGLEKNRKVFVMKCNIVLRSNHMI